MTRLKADPKLANELAEEAFGTSLQKHQANSYAPIPVAHINAAAKLVRRQSVVDSLEQWNREERTRNCKKRPAGRAPGWKRSVSVEALLILMLVHIMTGRGVLFTDMAQTLKHRLQPKQFAALGITQASATYAQWYDRLLNTKDYLETLIDPLPGNRRKLPTEEAMAEIMQDRASRAGELRAKRERLDTLLNDLVESSVLLLRQDIRERFRGNVALDATKIRMFGRAGVDRVRLTELRENMGLRTERDDDREESEESNDLASTRSRRIVRSINYDCGFYRRDGNHDGTSSGKHIREWALEMEIAVMTANRPGEAADFPLLAVAVGSHRPGAVTRAGLRILRDLERRKYRPAHFLVDMGYLPFSKTEDLQGPARDLGWIPVFDYKVNQLGTTFPYEDITQVEGQWYLAGMPEELVNAEKEYRTALKNDRMKARDLRLSAEERAALRCIRDQRRAERENFRLKAKGRPQPDGSQRFLYPNPDKYLLFDANTGAELPKPTRSTIPIPREVGLKFGQKYVHRGRKWRDWYGLRNTVEAFNSFVKDPLQTDIEDPRTRQARGNTFASLVATLVIVAANVRKIENFLMELHRGEPTTSKNKYETVAAIESEELLELEMIEAELLADGLEPPPR